ncbi:MAG: DMT family transporter, partial [Armatimonadetes bacterium]|nr:DMT family transporter [Armatimonadota bacterium]
LGFATYGLCINAGEKIIPAGTASMIVACIPVLTTLGAVLRLGERLTYRGWAGVVTAFGGMLIIGTGQAGGRAELIGLLLLFGGALSATGYNLLSKRYLSRYSALDLTTWAIWTGTLALLPAGGGLGAAWRAAPPSAAWTVVALGVVPSALCYSLFAYIIAHRPLARVASLLFLVPVIAVIMGYLILGEEPTLAALLGGAVVIGGVWLVNRR